MTRRLVVEADGGSRGNPGPAGYGALVRDAATGEVLAEVAEGIGRATNNVAEYRGLLAGLEAARAVDPHAHVEVRMDSKLVVEQMSGRWQVKHEDMRRLAQQARAVWPAGRVRYTWIPRAANAHADRLANEAMDAAARGRTWRREAGAAASLPASQSPAAQQQPRAPGPAPDVGGPTTLLLVRHGRTALTEARRFSGSGGDDPGLSAAGLQDATALATALAARGGVDVVVSSPLRRARETAAAVVKGLGLEPRVVDDWREVDFGAWDGATLAEVARREPGAVARWRESPDVAPPGGESLASLAARVGAARERLLAEHPGRVVVVVTHATPVRALVAGVLGAPLTAVQRLRVDPASVTELRLWADGGAELATANATAHLG